MSLFADSDLPEVAPAEPYRVLARKYRPADFDALIGQEAMVTTLANAIAANRLAQAWLLTGVRGVGKTSTARIIAKALNCIGPDGAGGPTIRPCGVCANCTAISAGQHIDVVEMDAASNTGVDNIREIIEAVRYASVSARYKVYIIDEVHMLSKGAFNAILKTLEEPPAHVKFIFATTEVQKLPATILSRCQRFDLKRVPADGLAAHFDRIVTAEGASAEADALALIARAAEGSVRDGLSILDQAIAMGDGAVTADAVRAMLGLADRGRTARILGHVLAGDAAAALAALGDAADAGVEPVALMGSLLDMVHGITRARMSGVDDPALSDEERATVRQWAERLDFPQLHRLWQLLLKGHGDVLAAPDPAQAADMALLRIIHAADLPDPDTLARLLAGGGATPVPPPVAAGPGGGRGEGAAAEPGASMGSDPVSSESRADNPAGFAAIVRLAEARRDAMLAKQLHGDVVCQVFAPGHLTVAACRPLPPDFPRQLARRLAEWTGREWQVALAPRDPGAFSLREQEELAEVRLRCEAEMDPRVDALLDVFPGAEIASTTLGSPFHQQGSR